jgi:hypothetical protein
MNEPGLLDGIAFCATHGCPMIKIGENYRCVIEYVDAALGMQHVIDFVPGSPTVAARLVFDNGRSFPLICACCGGPFEIADGAAFREGAVGLYLVAVGYVPPEADEPEALELVLAPEAMLDTLPDEMSGSLPDGVEVLTVHVDSARGID